jgi:prepilin peptidase CpaA
MDMVSAAWWPTLSLVLLASVADLVSRRIPNWLVLPFLVAGLIAVSIRSGWAGAEQSLAGIALGALVMAPPVWLGGIGMGDLKLCAAVGAWIGPDQLIVALVVMGIAGGIMAAVWETCRGSLGEMLDGVDNLVSAVWRPECRASLPALSQAGVRKLPYAPAIAIGTVFSFFAS